jgi:phosphatidylserine synthase
MAEHDKLESAKRLREVTDLFYRMIPLPNVDPNLVSGLSVVTSLLFILALGYSPMLAFILIILTLQLDYFDGLIAKKYGRCSEEGYIVDVACDRISEGLMFAPFFVPWFPLFALNTVPTVFGFAKNKHVILPLRHIFLAYYFFSFVL